MARVLTGVTVRAVRTRATAAAGWPVLVRRLLGRLGLLAGVLAVVFAAVDLLPGSAAKGALGADATPEAVAAKNAELGLDVAWPIRFLRWSAGLLTGDLGVSVNGQSVGELVVAALPETLMIVGAALAITVPTSMALGAWWAVRARRPARRVVDGLTTASIAVPEFVVATLLIVVFALGLDMLPPVTTVTASGALQSADMRVLPVLALAIPQIGWNSRVVHAAVVDHLADPHVVQATLDGIGPRTIAVRHVLPLALPTIATSAATSTGMLVGGAVVVETVFNHPGIGNLLSSAVTAKDAVATTAIVGLTGVLIAVILTAADAVRLAVTGRAS